MEGRATRAALAAWSIGVVLFLLLPIATIVLFAFDRSNVQSWPISHYTLSWFSIAWNDPQVRSAFVLSLKVGAAATILSLILGSAAAFGVHRFHFFGGSPSRYCSSYHLLYPASSRGLPSTRPSISRASPCPSSRSSSAIRPSASSWSITTCSPASAGPRGR